MYIFLDFDGVTHPLGKDDFSSLKHFIEVVSQFNVKIVFSTSWREYSNLEDLKKYFPETIHSKIIGMTPIINEDTTHPRFREILLYNKENNIKKHQWVAIDDNSYLFPENCRNLILINDGGGFSEKYATILTEKLNHINYINYLTSSPSL